MSSETSQEKTGTTPVFHLLHNKVEQLAVSRFSEPTPIQRLAIPKIIAGKNTLVISETGSGKTESVLLPVFSKLLEMEHKPIAVLYITPLKSLNRDMLDRILWWANQLEFGVTVRHGDTTTYERKLQTEHPDEIFIVTCEQLQAMLSGKRLRELLKNVKFIICDEVHELVNSKRGVQLTLALERLKQLANKPQMIALSATIGSPETAAKFIFVDGKFEIVNASAIKHMDLSVESPFPNRTDRVFAEKLFIGDTVAARLRRIYEIMKESRSVLAFTNTREAAEILSSRLRLLDKDFPHEVHHSSLSKDVRVKAEAEFKTEKLKALIATSSLQLGIDIGTVDLVLQYQSPRTVTQLLQRVGRSGHGIARVPKGIIIAAETEDVFESSVIARKALAGELEGLRPHTKSMDVLAHQLVGLANDEFRMDPKKAYEIVKRAWPYRDLTKTEFDKLLEFMEQLHLMWRESGLKRSRRALQYYFDNLSVIPDNRSYKVIDMTINAPVGNLDEGFVAEHNIPGSTFIVRGKPWRIISVEEKNIYVEPAAEIESAIPAWEGELIPVPFGVSQEVAKLRAEIAKDLKRGLGEKEIVTKIKEKYPVTSPSAAKMVALIKKHADKWPVPDEHTLLIESFGEYTVIHAPFGSTANETLARFIAALLSAEYGEAIASRSDPYRIIFSGCKPDDIKKVLRDYKPADISVILEKCLPRSSLFKHRFVQVAKRMGALRKDADMSKINIDKIIELYWGSPIHAETINELYTVKLDVERASEALADIQSGKIKIAETTGLSPIAEFGFRYELHDIAKPDRPEKEIFRLFRQRLLNTRIRIVCVNCGNYSVSSAVKEVENEPRCPKCHSKLLASVYPGATESQEIIKKRLKGKQLTDDEMKKLERIRRSADMIIVYGKKAIICLAGRGVGPQTASRILARMHLKDDEFYKDILKAEREFVRTHRFWS
jgi:ATP-dependent Lhr-like helicase